jgi:ribosomal protein S18 acetylase RimI-like enzyme
MELLIRPIDLNRDREHIIAYAKDLFTISFGNIARFVDQFGKDGSRYIPWIAEKQVCDPANAALAVLDGRPAGMVVFGPWVHAPVIGYVYHYYLEPRARGLRLAPYLDRYATSLMRRRGHSRARLSVAERNVPALRFYKKQGWAEAGARPDQPGIMYMTKTLSGCSP